MKKISKKDARLLKKLPASASGPSTLCKTTSGQVYKIAPGPRQGQHTLWHKTADGYLELAISDSPNELYDLIPWSD